MDSERQPTGRPPEEANQPPGGPESGREPADQDLDEPERADEAGPADDPGAPGATGANSALPPKLEAWRRRSAAGAILTGFALGLQEALETRKDEPSIMMETSGDPPKDLPVEAEFEYGRPRQSVVQIRPWLLPDQAAEATERGAEDGSTHPADDGSEPAASHDRGDGDPGRS